MLLHAGAIDDYTMQGTRGPGRRGFALGTADSGGPAADGQSGSSSNWTGKPGAADSSNEGSFWGNYVTQVVSGQATAGSQRQSFDSAAGNSAKPQRVEGVTSGQQQQQRSRLAEGAQQPIQQRASPQQPRQKGRLKSEEVAAAPAQPKHEQQPARQRKEPAAKAPPATKAEYAAAYSAAGSAAAAALRGLAVPPSAAAAKAAQQPSALQRDTKAAEQQWRRSSELPRPGSNARQDAASDAGPKRSSGQAVKGTSGVLGRALKDAVSRDGPGAAGGAPPGLAVGVALQALPGSVPSATQPASWKAAADRPQRQSTADKAPTAPSVDAVAAFEGHHGGGLPQRNRASRRGNPRTIAGNCSPRGGDAGAAAEEAVTPAAKPQIAAGVEEAAAPAAAAAGSVDSGGSLVSPNGMPRGTQLTRSQQKRASKKRQKERRVAEQQAQRSGVATMRETTDEAQQPPASSSLPGVVAASTGTAAGQLTKSAAHKSSPQPHIAATGAAPSNPAKPQQANTAPKQREAEQAAAPAAAEEPEGGRSGVMARLAAFMGPRRGLFSKVRRNVHVCRRSCHVQLYLCQSCCKYWHSPPHSSASTSLFLGKKPDLRACLDAEPAQR